MQTKIIRIIHLLFTANFSLTQLSAQDGIIKYRYILNVDSTMTVKNVEGIPSFLYFSPIKSLFVFDRLKDTAFISRSAEDASLHDGAVVDYEERDEYGNMFYKDFAKRRLLMRRLIFSEAFIAEESLADIHWKILTDTRRIGGFNCEKAIAHFRGRYYEAWFTRDIPISDGPWKLHGLPGLILEAYDSNKEIQYLFESIKLPFVVNKDIIEPQKGSRISFDAFKNIEQTQTDKMIKMVKASMDRKDEVDIKVKIFPIEKNYE